jgi:hypothetical protein
MSWQCDRKNGRVVVDELGRKVATANSTPWNPTEAWSNAKLIAMIPEAFKLLEAAKDALPSDDLVYLRIREFLDVE